MPTAILLITEIFFKDLLSNGKNLKEFLDDYLFVSLVQLYFFLQASYKKFFKKSYF